MRNKLVGLALRISLLYAFFGGLWIVLWGFATVNLVHDPRMASTLNRHRGWVLVAVTALMLYFVLRRQMKWLESEVEGRAQAEQLMRESQVRFVTIFRSSPVGITLSKLDDGEFIDANPAILKALGYSREELTGRSAREIGLYVSPESRDRLVEMVRAQGRVENEELQFKKKNGEVGTMLGSAELIDLGDKAHVLAMMLDITDRKRAEDACRESENFYHAVFEHSLAGLAIIEENGIISLANAQLCKALGYPREAIEGKMRWMDLLVPEDRKRLEASHRARMAEPDSAPMQFECRVRRGDGSIMRGFIRVAFIPGTRKTIFSGMEALGGGDGAYNGPGGEKVTREGLNT